MMKRLLSLVTLGIVLPMLFACDNTSPWITYRDGPKVAVVGDSLVALYQTEWERGPFARDGAVALNPASGSTYSYHHAWLQSLSPRPDVAVIALGINNAMLGGWTSTDESHLWQAMSKVADVDTVVLVTMGWAGNSPDFNFSAAAEAGNSYIRYIARTGGPLDPSQVRLANWYAAAATLNTGPNGDWFDPVHFKPVGSALYQQVIFDASKAPYVPPTPPGA